MRLKMRIMLSLLPLLWGASQVHAQSIDEVANALKDLQKQVDQLRTENEKIRQKNQALETKLESPPASVMMVAPEGYVPKTSLFVRAPRDCWGVFGSVDALFWKARTNAPSYMGTVSQGTGLTSNSVTGASALNYDSDTGFRLNIGVISPSGLDFTFTYTNFDTSASQSLGNASVDSDTVYAGIADRNLAGAFPIAPARIADGVADFASASQNIRYHAYDFDFGMNFQATERLGLRPFLGVRHTLLGENSSALYSDIEAGGAISRSSLTTQSYTMTGTGLHGGLNSNWALGRGFSLFGGVGASLLYGNFTASRTDTFTQSVPGVTLTRAYTDSWDSIVPNIDLSIGISYTRGRLFVATGYEYSQYFNVGGFSSASGNGVVNAANVPGGNLTTSQYGSDSSNVGFSGLFLRAGLTY